MKSQRSAAKWATDCLMSIFLFGGFSFIPWLGGVAVFKWISGVSWTAAIVIAIGTPIALGLLSLVVLILLVIGAVVVDFVQSLFR